MNERLFQFFYIISIKKENITCILPQYRVRLLMYLQRVENLYFLYIFIFSRHIKKSLKGTFNYTRTSWSHAIIKTNVDKMYKTLKHSKNRINTIWLLSFHLAIISFNLPGLRT